MKKRRFAAFGRSLLFYVFCSYGLVDYPLVFSSFFCAVIFFRTYVHVYSMGRRRILSESSFETALSFMYGV